MLMIKQWENGNQFGKTSIEPNHMIIEFHRLISESITCDTTEPIVWKTTPSRRNISIGQFQIVQIDPKNIPSIQYTLVAGNTNPMIMNTSLRNDKKDTFFSQLSHSFEYGTTGDQIKINIRKFLLYVLIWKSNGHISKKQFTTAKINLLMTNHVFQSIDFVNWFKDEHSFRAHCKNAKKGWEKYSPDKIIILTDKISSFSFDLDANAFDYDENINDSIIIDKAFWIQCFSGINKGTASLIRQQYQEFLNTSE